MGIKIKESPSNSGWRTITMMNVGGEYFIVQQYVVMVSVEKRNVKRDGAGCVCLPKDEYRLRRLQDVVDMTKLVEAANRSDT